MPVGRTVDEENTWLATPVTLSHQHPNTVQSAHDIIQRIVQNRPAALQIQRELVDEGKDIINTAAGEAINRELNEQMRRHQVELREVQGEMAQALRAKDEETMRELEEARKKLRERMEETAKDSEGMTSSYAAEKRRVEARMNEMELGAKREREQAEIERRRHLANHTPQDETNADVADQPRLKQETNPPSTKVTERADYYQHSPPKIASHPSSPQVFTLGIPYARVPFVWPLTATDSL